MPSPPLVGALQSRLSLGKSPAEAAQQWRISLSVISLLLIVSGVLFLLAAKLSVPSADWRTRDRQQDTDEEDGVAEPRLGNGEGADVRPLLGEGRSDDAANVDSAVDKARAEG